MGASFKTQANALLRKSAIYQKRNIGTNCCLLSAPIFFCLLLLLIRILVNTLFLSGPNFECGCYCNNCCKGKDCKPLAVCDDSRGFECKAYDKERCGLLYSTSRQAQWCEIKNPSTWPPFMTVPKQRDRAKPYAPAVAALSTSLGPDTFANDVAGIITLPNITTRDFTNALPRIFRTDGSVNAAELGRLGFQLGTAANPPQSLYIETAFLSDQDLQFLYPATTTDNCASFGLGNASLPFLNFTAKYINLMNPSAPKFPLDQLYANISGRLLAGNFLIPTKCLDVLIPNNASVANINRAMYCGYTQAMCYGTMMTAEFPTGFELNTSTTNYANLVVYYNQTAGDSENGPQRYQRITTLLNMAVRGWWRNSLRTVRAIGVNTTGLADNVDLQGVMSMPKLSSKLKLDFSTLLGPLFYTWVVQLLLPTFLQQLVYEKEKRLRMMMKMHGLGDGAYWLITYLWYLALYIVYMLIFVIFGAAIGLEVFRRTNFGIQAIFYFLFGNCMIAFTFMLSSLFTSSRTATVVAFLYVFATGLIGELLLKIFMVQNETWVFFVEWVPAWALYRGLWEMAEYSFVGVLNSSLGLTFDSLSESGNGMRACFAIFVVEWAVFMVMGWYLEQVLSSGTGIRRHPLFFLEWCWKKRSAGPGSVEMGARLSDTGASDSKVVGVTPQGELADVQAERARVEALPAGHDTPIMVKGLRKVYPALDGGKSKIAVRTLTMGIERGECFGLLGPNGAGKSTSINMLTGFLEPSSGTAVVEGHDILTQMGSIYKLMGVCPQHDLLWEQLTGEEHLYFYGRLKGLRGAELTDAVDAGLRSVNLWNGKVGQKQSQKYSGGMKRRLSVAISFMGAPAVVYLDEPSTGLDPASRRALWDVVKSSKAGRAIILTTHSMEEAETLCDRLGIFVDGRLVCIGNPREITSRYAGYLVFTITVTPQDEQAARALTTAMCPGANLTYAVGGTLKYELPTSEVSLASVFSYMRAAKERGSVNVLDWGVANATLEEVFIKFARTIGAETKDD